MALESCIRRRPRGPSLGACKAACRNRPRKAVWPALEFRPLRRRTLDARKTAGRFAASSSLRAWAAQESKAAAPPRPRPRPAPSLRRPACTRQTSILARTAFFSFPSCVSLIGCAPASTAARNGLPELLRRNVAAPTPLLRRSCATTTPLPCRSYTALMLIALLLRGRRSHATLGAAC